MWKKTSITIKGNSTITKIFKELNTTLFVITILGIFSRKRVVKSIFKGVFIVDVI